MSLPLSGVRIETGDNYRSLFLKKPKCSFTADSTGSTNEKAPFARESFGHAEPWNIKGRLIASWPTTGNVKD